MQDVVSKFEKLKCLKTISGWNKENENNTSRKKCIVKGSDTKHRGTMSYVGEYTTE